VVPSVPTQRSRRDGSATSGMFLLSASGIGYDSFQITKPNTLFVRYTGEADVGATRLHIQRPSTRCDATPSCDRRRGRGRLPTRCGRTTRCRSLRGKISLRGSTRCTNPNFAGGDPLFECCLFVSVRSGLHEAGDARCSSNLRGRAGSEWWTHLRHWATVEPARVSTSGCGSSASASVRMRPSPHGAGDVECLLVGFAMAALALTDQVTGTVRVRMEPDERRGRRVDGRPRPDWSARVRCADLRHAIVPS
jgi:hypothetical protein